MENYFMDYDKTTGQILGFYIYSIHGNNIPKGCIEISQEKYEYYISNSGLVKLNPETLEDIIIPLIQTQQSQNETEVLKERINQIEQEKFLLEQRVTQAENDNLISMEALAEVYEQMLAMQ